jgi:lysozyme
MHTIIDVSNNNGGSINWTRVKESGVAGVLLKATEGLGFTDGTFESRRAAANKVGLIVGSYHFGHRENDPVAEAKHYLSVVGKLGKYDFKPVLDFELGSPQQSDELWIHRFNATVKNHLGVYPIFYSYSSFIEGLDLAKPVGDGLWLASYSRNDGKDHGAAVPAPWKKWNLLQYTSKGTVGGVSGGVDLSHAITLKGLLAHPWLSKV